MNTLFDPKATSPESQALRPVTQGLTALGELGAIMAEQLRQTPTLQGTARDALIFWLRGRTQFPNPDALFIHLAADGHPKALSLTHALLQAFMGNRTYLDDPRAVLSLHRRADEPQHQIADLDMASVRRVCADVLPRLAGLFNYSLNAYWEDDEHTFSNIPGENAVTGFRSEILASIHQRMLAHEIPFGVDSRYLNQQDAKILTDVTRGDASNSYSIVLQTPNGDALPLVGVLVVKGRDDDLYLFSPGLGIEKFITTQSLRDWLVERLSSSESADQIVHHLSLEHQILAAAIVPATLQLELKRLSDAAAKVFISEVRQKQLDDVEYVLEQARLNTDDHQAFLQMFDDASQSDDMNDLLNTRYSRLLASIDALARPDWLKWGASGDVQRYEELKKERTHLEHSVRQLTVGFESFDAYARREIEAYTTSFLGYSLDPERVRVSLPDTITMRGETLETVYRQSMLHFAVNGMPDFDLAKEPGIEVDPSEGHPQLDFSFVNHLVHSLDLSHRYDQQVQRLYRSSDMRHALARLQASEIAFSAQAAKMQGHLSPRGLDLISRVQAGNRESAQWGAVALKTGNRRLEDVLVLRDLSAGDEFCVLYAPGLPGGRNLFDFPTWRQLSFEIGGWIADAQKTRYLLDQSGGGEHQDLATALDAYRLKPAAWSAENIVFVRLDTHGFDDALARCADYKVEQVLNRSARQTGTDKTKLSLEQEKTAVTLKYRIAALNAAYNAYGIMPWRDAARQECQRLIDVHMKASGVPAKINPDTVFCDVVGDHDHVDMDLGRLTSLKCLTDLFMAGYSSEDYEFHDGAILHSSIGQDLSGLSASFIDQMIRSSDFADEYIAQLRKHTWGLTNSPPERVMALFSRKKSCELLRDALIALSRGQLNPSEYDWLVDVIASHDDTGQSSQRQRGTLHPLLLERVYVADVFLFKPHRSESHTRTLVYTPQAPDGLLFRYESDIVASVQRPGMSQYYYDRVTYSRQRIIGTLMQKLEVSSIVDGRPYVVGIGSASSSYRAVHLSMMNLLIVDIDSQTQSANERRMLNTYNFVRKYGGYVAKLNPTTAAVWHAFHAGVDLFRGIYAYQEGDRARAREFFISAASEAFKSAKKVRKVRKQAKLKRLKAREASTRPTAGVLA